MYSRILIPTDGSRGMASAISHALKLAMFHDSEIHILHVIDVRAYAMLPEHTQSQVHSLLKTEGEKAVDGIVQLATDREIDTIPMLKVGIPHEEIINYGIENEVDLIIMGTHGQTGETKRIVGSVAEEVVRNAEIPVIVIRMKETDLEEVKEAIPSEQQRYIA